MQKIITGKSKKPLIFGLIAVTALGVIGGGLYYARHRRNSRTDTNQLSNQQVQQPEDDGLSKSKGEAAKTSNPIDNQKPSEEIPSNNLSLTISELVQTGGNVTTTAVVNGATESGTCVATFKKADDKPVVRQVNGTLSGGQAKCGPITIPEVEFTSLGTWTLTLRYYANGGQTEANKEIVIR